LWDQLKRPGQKLTVCHSSTLNSRLLDLNSTEQSENVYENKGSVQKSTTPDPTLSKEGNCGLPDSGVEGLGWSDFADFAHFAPWRETESVTMKNDGTKRECL
jgi:hypothetical protein